MIRDVVLDMDVLRTFVLGMDLGSFAKAAERRGRSPSAISQQLRKLEEQAGQPLFIRQGRTLGLTEAGERLLGYARRILDLNDEAVASLREASLDGWIRLGLPQDFAETRLPALLGRFARMHPRVRIEVRADRTAALIEGVVTGTLDLALAWGNDPGPNRRRVETRPMAWIGPPGFRLPAGEPLPLIAFDPPCLFRQAAVEALDRAGIAWRHAYASPGLTGLWAGVAAGFGVTVRTREGIPAGLVALPPDAGLPVLPDIDLSLYAVGQDLVPAAQELHALLAGAFTPLGAA